MGCWLLLQPPASSQKLSLLKRLPKPLSHLLLLEWLCGWGVGGGGGAGGLGGALGLGAWGRLWRGLIGWGWAELSWAGWATLKRKFVLFENEKEIGLFEIGKGVSPLKK